MKRPFGDGMVAALEIRLINVLGQTAQRFEIAHAPHVGRSCDVQGGQRAIGFE